MPEFLKKQRWFAGKARDLASTRIVEASHPQGFPEGTLLILVEVRYDGGDRETYFLPIRLADGDKAEHGRARRPAGSSPGSPAHAATDCSMTA